MTIITPESLAWLKRMDSEDAIKAAVNLALEAAAKAVEKHDVAGREWIPGSLWDTLANEAAARIRALKTKEHNIDSAMSAHKNGEGV